MDPFSIGQVPEAGGSSASAPHRSTPQWARAAIAIAAAVALLYVIELIDVISGDSLQDGGIEPRELDGLWGILFAPLLHDDWAHLASNTVPLLVLGFMVVLASVMRGAAVVAIIWVVAGFGTWLIGGANTNHIGASGIVFGLLAYLIVRGIFSRSAIQIAIGLVVLVFYGGMLWGVLPSGPRISWEGHLFGAVGGVVAAWVVASDARDARRKRSRAASGTEQL